MKLTIQITRGLIRDLRMRRLVMFFGMLADLVMLFAGAVFLDKFLLDKPWLFILYWVICGWLTLTILLLAIYDMIVMRATAIRDRRRLREEIFRGDDKN